MDVLAIWILFWIVLGIFFAPWVGEKLGEAADRAGDLFDGGEW